MVLNIKPEVSGQRITSNLISVDEKLYFKQPIYHHRETQVSRAVELQYNRVSHDADPSVVLEHTQTNILFRGDVLLPMQCRMELSETDSPCLLTSASS